MTDQPSLTPATESPRPGYTLPVFACASAIAALKQLRQTQPDASTHQVSVDLINPKIIVEIPIEQAAVLPDGSALAISRSDPGDNLDLTRHTPVWAQVRWGDRDQSDQIAIAGGEGIGRQQQYLGKAAIYRYAQTLISHNLKALLRPSETLQITIILPEGRQLATRTSNAAFGVVDGLSLLGTTGISQPLSAPGQLAEYRSNLRQQAQLADLVFCLGENGLDVALGLGIAPERRVKTANWVGPMLVEAALLEVRSLLLLGYHGKLIKLAGGIFHTHHHVADGRQEILAAHSASLGLPLTSVRTILQNGTVEASLKHLRQLEAETRQSWVAPIYEQLAGAIETRSKAYIQKQGAPAITLGVILFDGDRQPFVLTPTAKALLPRLCYSNQN